MVIYLNIFNNLFNLLTDTDTRGYEYQIYVRKVMGS